MDGKTSFVIKGAAAEIRWGYHRAAALEQWEVKENSATAKVVSLDRFRVTQRPLKFVAHTPSGHRWTWEINSLQVAGQTVSMSLAEE